MTGQRNMELKTARLTLLIDPNKKAAFERLCAQQDRTPSQVVRQLIREHLARHGVEYIAGGTAGGTADLPEQPACAPTPPKKKPAGRSASTAAARTGPRRR
jgi:hypothetical protein